jgi:hypothetical protein
MGQLRKALCAIGGAIALASALCVPAQASIIYVFTETDGNVVGTLSGSVDTTGLTVFSGTKVSAPLFNPGTGQLFSGPGGPVAVIFGAFAAQSWGSVGFHVADSTTGDPFAIAHTNLFLPFGYVSGAALSGTLTFLSATFASLGITPGSYVYTLPNEDTVTVRFEAPAPEPATLALLSLGLAGLAVARRRKLN